MIVNNEQQKEPVQVLQKEVVQTPQKEPEQTPQKEPTNKFNTERAYEWLYNLSGESRDFYDDTRVAKYSNEFIKNRFKLIYTQLGKPMPPQEELDSLYLSFFDKVEVEKKNPVLTSESQTPISKETTESPSTSKTTPSLSESKPKKNRFVDQDAMTDEDMYGSYRTEDSQPSYNYAKIANEQEPPAWASEQVKDDYVQRKKLYDFVEREGYLDKEPVDKTEKETEEREYSDLYAQHNQMFNESATFAEYIKKSDISWFNMNEEDAEIQFEQIYGRLGFTATQTGRGTNKLIITSPDGVDNIEVRLFTDKYKSTNEKHGDMEYRDGFHKTRIKNWMSEEIKKVPDPLMIAGTDRVDVASKIKAGFQLSTVFSEEDKSRLFGIMEDDIYSAYDEGMIFNPEKAEQLLRLKIKESAQYLEYRKKDYDKVLSKHGRQQESSSMKRFDISKETNKEVSTEVKQAGLSLESSQERHDFLQETYRKFLSEKQMYSSVVGQSLIKNDTYKMFDFANSDEDMYLMAYAGVNFVDIPLEQISINGRAGTYNEAVNILTDYASIRQARLGKLDVSIDLDNVTGDIAKSLLEDLGSIKERNKVERFEEYKEDNLMFKTRIGLENMGDFFQNIGLSTLGVVADTRYAVHDLLSPLFGDEAMDAWLTGKHKENLPRIGGSGSFSPRLNSALHPEMIKNLKEEYLPLYGSNISDARTFGEFMAYGSDALANSLPASAMFMINPTLGLVTIGATTYGSEMYNIDTEIASIRERVNNETVDAETLDARSRKMMEMTRLEARALALSKAGIEVAFTRAFTYNFFKNAAAAKNFSGARNQLNAQGIAREYTKHLRLGLSGKVGYYTGLSSNAILREIPEEELIAMSTYGVETAWGLREYNQQEVEKLMADTGLNSLFSSMGMAKLAQAGNVKNVTNGVDNLIKNNLFIDNEVRINALNLDAQQALAKELSRPESRQDKETIDFLTQVVDESSQKVVDFDNRKQEILDDMIPEDKKQIVDAFGEIEKIQEALIRDNEPFVANTSIDKINSLREQVKKVMLKYPSEHSFKYLPLDAQQKYKEDAVEAIIDEEYNGNAEGLSYSVRVSDNTDEQPNLEQNSDEDITEQQINERAVKMYLDDVRNKERENKESITVLPGFDVLSMYNYVPTVTREELDAFNLSDALTISNQKIANLELDFGAQPVYDKPAPRLEVDKEGRIVEGIRMTADEIDVRIDERRDKYLQDLKELQEEYGVDKKGVSLNAEEINAKRIQELEQKRAEELKAVEEKPVEEKEEIPFEIRSNSRISAETNVYPKAGKQTTITLTPSMTDYENLSPSENSLAIALDIAHVASKYSNTVSVQGGILRLIENNRGYYALDILRDHYSGFITRSIDDVIKEFRGSEADLSLLRQLLEARQKPDTEEQSPTDEINARYDAEISNVQTGVNQDYIDAKAELDKKRREESQEDLDRFTDEGRRYTEGKPATGMEGDVSLDARSENEQRLQDVLSRLEAYNNEGDFMSFIGTQGPKISDQKRQPSELQSHVIQFFNDIENGRTANLGNIEAILDASDISRELLSQMPSDLKLNLGNDNLINMMNTLTQQVGMGMNPFGESLAGVSVLMNSVFRDSKTGKQFINLNNEASRIVAEVKQNVSKIKEDHIKAYEEDAKNDTDYLETKNEEFLNPNSLTNSYEQSILGSLYRLMGETNLDGVDVEFQRNKNLILQELAIRKEDYEANKDDKAKEIAYRKWESVVNKLGVADAKSYEQVRANASARNANMIDRLAEAQPTDAALKRIKDFNRFQPKVLNRYLPSFLRVSTNNQGYVDAFGLPDEDGTIGGANQTKDVTMPESLLGSNNIRLSTGMYFDQAYGSLQGLQMDIEGRKTYRTLTYLMQMPSFQGMFEGNSVTESGRVNKSEEYQRFEKLFLQREQTFDKDIQYSHRKPVDVGEVTHGLGTLSNSMLQATYSTVAAISLTRLSQNTSQFQSAVNGSLPMVSSHQARAHLMRATTQFYTGTAGLLNGNHSKTWVGKTLEKQLGITPYASNIYAQSQTGLRNSIASELITNQNKKYPLSYYLRRFNMIEEDVNSENSQKVIKKFEEGGLPTILDKKQALYYPEQFMNLIAKSQNLALEVGLAMGDRAAANATFESFYIDHRIKNGAEYSMSNPRAFWDVENKNPNKEAIRYADEMVDRTQLQTVSTGQAGLYSEYSDPSNKTRTQLFIPYQKFIMNARIDVAAQMMKIQDPNVTEDDKIIARGALKGRIAEVATFSATRNMQWTALAKGSAGLMVMFGMTDDDDVERYNMATEFVGDYLPIEDRSIVSPPNKRIEEAESFEEQQIIAAQNKLMFSNLRMDAHDLHLEMMEYEGKFKMSNFEPDFMRDVMQEIVSVGFTVPRPNIVTEAGNIFFNKVMSEAGIQVQADEFLSSDVKGMNTPEGWKNLVEQNLGVATIGIEQAAKLKAAYDYMTLGMKYKSMPLSPEGEIPVSISSLTQPQREQLANVSRTLFISRMAMIITPIPVKGDVNKILARMERQLETYYDAVGTDSDGRPMGEFDTAPRRQSVLEQE
jgi:hypothetical protein